MRIVLVQFILMVCLSSACTADAKMFLFDMGSADSQLRDGFTRVTSKSLYDKRVGYGWKSGDGLATQYKHYDHAWRYSESRGRKQPPEFYTNEITCDTIRSDKENSFLVDVPAGEYTVYVLSGLSAGSGREYHWFNIAAASANATVKIPGPYRFEKSVLKVSVKEGPLSIGFLPQTDWLVTSIMVFPTAGEAQVRDDFLDALEKEIYFLPPGVAEKWKKTEHIDRRPLPDFDPADKRRGYAIFARHWSEVIYPNTVPKASELNPELKAFASLGEYEPLTFTVFPFQSLGACRVTAGNLQMGNAIIPKDSIDIRSVRTMFVRPNYSLFFSYYEAPDVLEHRASVAIAEGRNQRYWITVKVPGDAKPGIYEGKLTFRPASGQSCEVGLKVRILPIRLQKDPTHIYGTYYRDPLSRVADGNRPIANDYFRRKAELERRDMVEHGMNSHISSATGLKRDDNGNWTMDGTETEQRIALDRKYGMTKKPLVVSFPVSSWYYRLVDKKGMGSHLRLIRPNVPESFFDEVTKMVVAIEKEKKKYDWPEFLYYPVDEPSTQEDSVRFMVDVLKAIKRVPGVRTYVTADPTHEQFEPMWPYVDVWCCQPFVFGYEKIKRLSREKNCEFWCYPNHVNGENDHTPVRGSRMTFGFGLWKSGFTTLMPWIYQSNSGDPWNYLDGRAMDFFNRSEPDGTPIPVTMWEAYREGIDDGRYIYTLRQWIEKAKASSPAAAERAERELKYVWDAIEVQEKYKVDGLWSGADFDAYRWLLASRIIELQGALGR